MKIRSLILKVPEPKLKIIKSVTVYISKNHCEIIIAPNYKEPKAGYCYEQDICEIIDLKSSSEIIGESIKRNFNKFDIKKNTNTNRNKSDWSAFKSSKEKTMIGFEKNYQRISVRGITEYNDSFKIETVLNYVSKIELTTTISAHCENSELGNRIIKIFNSEICDRK
jgi:hypothetical protein